MKIFYVILNIIFLITQNVMAGENKPEVIEKIMQEKMQKMALQYQACIEKSKVIAQGELSHCDKEFIEYLYFVQKNKELSDVSQECDQAREESDAWQTAFKKSEFKRFFNYIFGFEIW